MWKILTDISLLHKGSILKIERDISTEIVILTGLTKISNQIIITQDLEEDTDYTYYKLYGYYGAETLEEAKLLFKQKSRRSFSYNTFHPERDIIYIWVIDKINIDLFEEEI